MRSLFSQVLIVIVILFMGVMVARSEYSAASITLTNLTPSWGSVGTPVTALGSGFTARDNAVNIGESTRVVTGLRSPDRKTLNFPFPATPCPFGQSCSRVVTAEGWVDVSITNRKGLTSNRLPFYVLGPGFYFEFTDASSDTFVIKLTSATRVAEARRLLSSRTNTQPEIPRLVAGRIVKTAVPYNPQWSFHLDPATIVFPEASIEVCDATIRAVEEDLEAVGGAFLPANWWCPWSAQLTRELSFP